MSLWFFFFGSSCVRIISRAHDFFILSVRLLWLYRETWYSIILFFCSWRDRLELSTIVPSRDSIVFGTIVCSVNSAVSVRSEHKFHSSKKKSWPLHNWKILGNLCFFFYMMLGISVRPFRAYKKGCWRCILCELTRSVISWPFSGLMFTLSISLRRPFMNISSF